MLSSPRNSHQVITDVILPPSSIPGLQSILHPALLGVLKETHLVTGATAFALGDSLVYYVPPSPTPLGGGTSHFSINGQPQEGCLTEF